MSLVDAEVVLMHSQYSKKLGYLQMAATIYST